MWAKRSEQNHGGECLPLYRYDQRTCFLQMKRAASALGLQRSWTHGRQVLPCRLEPRQGFPELTAEEAHCAVFLHLPAAECWSVHRRQHSLGRHYSVVCPSACFHHILFGIIPCVLCIWKNAEWIRSCRRKIDWTLGSSVNMLHRKDENVHESRSWGQR